MLHCECIQIRSTAHWHVTCTNWAFVVLLPLRRADLGHEYVSHEVVGAHVDVEVGHEDVLDGVDDGAVVRVQAPHQLA